MPEMESLQGERSIFYARLCKKADKWPTRHWPGLFYSQLQQPPCNVTQRGAPTHLPLSHPFCYHRTYLQNGLRQLITSVSGGGPGREGGGGGGGRSVVKGLIVLSAEVLAVPVASNTNNTATKQKLINTPLMINEPWHPLFAFQVMSIVGLSRMIGC